MKTAGQFAEMFAEMFRNCLNVNEAKSLYRQLVMTYHPDRKGGSNESMKELNLAYEATLKSRDGEQSAGSDGKEHYYRWNETVERAAMDIISKLIALNMTDVEIDLVGTWVWVGGNTRTYKEEIKQIGLRWHSKRVRWYWRPTAYKTHYNARLSYGDLQEVYGTRRFESQTTEEERKGGVSR